MSKAEQIEGLTAQMIAAAGKGDHAAVQDLSGQIQALAQPATFEKAWGLDKSEPKTAPNAFEKAWGFNKA